MNQKLKTLVLTDGAFDHASSRIRAILYFQLFRESLNMQICWKPRIPIKRKNRFYSYCIFPVLKRWYFINQVLSIVFCRYDLVFIQRYFLKEFLIKILKKRKSKLIFDFDDAIYLDNPGENKNYDKTMLLLRAANHIIVSSNELATFCIKEGFTKISKITTPIDVERFHIHQINVNNPVTIGWIGSTYTTAYLKVVVESILEISKKFRIQLLLIGAKSDFNMPDVTISVIPWDYESEPKLISQMDIGIMPLTNDAYSRGKGGYKLFQYMSAGVPVIASPIGINTEIVKHGENGFLAENSKEWTYFLKFLIENSEERKKMGEKGRQEVERNYSRQYCFKKISHIIKEELEWNNKIS